MTYTAHSDPGFTTLGRPCRTGSPAGPKWGVGQRIFFRMTGGSAISGADGAQHWARLVAMPGWVPWPAARLVARQEVWLREIGFMPVHRRFVSNRAYCTREFLMAPSPGRRRDFADHCL